MKRFLIVWIGGFLISLLVLSPMMFAQAQHKKKLSEKEFMEQTIIQQDDQIRKDKEQMAILQE